jgi:hypothetical protein
MSTFFVFSIENQTNAVMGKGTSYTPRLSSQAFTG